MKKLLTIFFLISTIFTANAQESVTQETPYKEARTWNVISSIMGTTVENTKIIGKSNGMVMIGGEEDEDMALKLYAFIPKNSKTKEDNPLYYIGFKKEKCAFILVEYRYTSKTKLDLQKDLMEIKNQIEISGYKFVDKKTEEHNGAFDLSWVNFRYFFINTKMNKEVRIFHDARNSSFMLKFGEKKYLDKIEALNKE